MFPYIVGWKNANTHTSTGWEWHQKKVLREKKLINGIMRAWRIHLNSGLSQINAYIHHVDYFPFHLCISAKPFYAYTISTHRNTIFHSFCIHEFMCWISSFLSIILLITFRSLVLRTDIEVVIPKCWNFSIPKIFFFDICWHSFLIPFERNLFAVDMIININGDCFT